MGKPQLSDEAMDAIIEWLFCYWPCSLEDPQFVRGLFFICDEEVRQAIDRERERTWRQLSACQGRN